MDASMFQNARLLDASHTAIMAARNEVAARVGAVAADLCTYSSWGAEEYGSATVDVKRTFVKEGRIRRLLGLEPRKVTGAVTALVDPDCKVTFVRPHGQPDAAAMSRLGF